eukprot:COSAG05_NODE_2871_length_2554_cov_14.393140_2_plen_399_part_00
MPGIFSTAGKGWNAGGRGHTGFSFGVDAAVTRSMVIQANPRPKVSVRNQLALRRHSLTGQETTDAAAYSEYLRQSLARDDWLPPGPPFTGEPTTTAAVQPSTGKAPTLSFVRKTTKYWIKKCDMQALKKVITQNLPLFQFNQDLVGDSQLCNSVYLDNEARELYNARLDKTPGALAIRLRWYDVGEPDVVFVERKTHRESWAGEVSVKERFALNAGDVVPFLLGQHGCDQVADAMRQGGKSEESIKAMAQLFDEVYDAIQSKVLRPAVRTQYFRTAWQSDASATVRISLDEQLFMLNENPKREMTMTGISTLDAGRWFRDPYAPLEPDELTWFPHGVLEVKLALAEGEVQPQWVCDMLDSGLVHEVNKFSKFLHGTATLMPHTVNNAPYWMDDASIVS